MRRLSLFTAIILPVLQVAVTGLKAQPAVIRNASNPETPSVLYIGIENEIHVSVEGVPFNELQLDVPYGITKKAGGKIFVRIGKSDTITCTEVILYTPVNDKRQEYMRKKFDIRPLPDPVIDLPGLSAGRISKLNLISQKGLSLVMKNFNLQKQPFTIVKFKIEFYKDGKSVSATSTSGRVTKEQTALISENASPGTKLRFDDLYIIGPDFVLRKLSPVEMVIE